MDIFPAYFGKQKTPPPTLGSRLTIAQHYCRGIELLDSDENGLWSQEGLPIRGQL